MSCRMCVTTRGETFKLENNANKYFSKILLKYSLKPCNSFCLRDFDQFTRLLLVDRIDKKNKFHV